VSKETYCSVKRDLLVSKEGPDLTLRYDDTVHDDDVYEEEDTCHDDDDAFYFFYRSSRRNNKKPNAIYPFGYR